MTIKNGILKDINGNIIHPEIAMASTSQLGGVKVDGTTIEIDNNGVISTDTSEFLTQEEASETYQEKLVSGTNVKTVNNQSILGEGNITISGSDASWGNITGTLSDQTDLNTALGKKLESTNLIQGRNITLTKNGNNVTIAATGEISGTVNWGDIQGTLSDQVDMRDILINSNAISDLTTPTTSTTGSYNEVCAQELTADKWSALETWISNNDGYLTKIKLSSNFVFSEPTTFAIAIVDITYDSSTNKFNWKKKYVSDAITIPANTTEYILPTPLFIGKNQAPAIPITNLGLKWKQDKINGSEFLLWQTESSLTQFNYNSGSYTKANLKVTLPIQFEYSYKEFPNYTSEIQTLHNDIDTVDGKIDGVKEDTLVTKQTYVGNINQKSCTSALNPNKALYVSVGDANKALVDGYVVSIDCLPAPTADSDIAVAAVSYTPTETSSFTAKVESVVYATLLEGATSVTLDTPLEVKAGQYIGLYYENQKWGNYSTDENASKAIYKTYTNASLVKVNDSVTSRQGVVIVLPPRFNFSMPTKIKDKLAEDELILSNHEDRITTLEGNIPSNTVSIEDMTKLLLLGSSLTASGLNVSTATWVERLNDMVDVNIINNGIESMNLKDELDKLATNATCRYASTKRLRDIKPTWIMENNTANGTAVGETAIEQYRNLSRLCASMGAKLLLGSEENYAKIYPQYERTKSSYAEEAGIPYSSITRVSEMLYPRAAGWIKYPVFNQNHSSYRSISPYMMHFDLVNSLPIYKNIKVFHVRPTYKAGNPTISDLAYDTNMQRMQFWRGSYPGSAGGLVPGHLDNPDNANYDVPNTTQTSYNTLESLPLYLGNTVSFSKFALIEFILEKTNITKGTFSANINVNPTKVYIAKTINETATYTTDFIRTSFVELTGWTYSNGVLTASFENDTLHQYELYDKVRIVIETSGAFTIAKPKFYDYDGNDKVYDATIPYHARRYGTELLTANNPSTWTTSGTATAGSLPEVIANYTKYNNTKSHAELVADGDYVQVSESISNPAFKKVAVRIVGQIWNKISTTRFDETEYASSPYITNTKDDPLGLAAYVNGDYDYGRIRVTINTYTVKDIILYPGWCEHYFEFDLTPDDATLDIKIEKKSFVDDSYNNDDKPIFIHHVSIQEIE